MEKPTEVDLVWYGVNDDQPIKAQILPEYYGTKRLHAWPKEQDGQLGYAVRYSDGYISWSPKDVFEAAYQPITAMNFGHALQALKDGHRVARSGWNGKGMWLRMVDPYAPVKAAGGQFSVTELSEMDGTLITHPYIRNTNGTMVPWHPSLGDLMAEDWCIVEDADDYQLYSGREEFTVEDAT